MAQDTTPHREPASDQTAPSAELLMFLAEFGDDTGAVDDPVAVDRAMGEGDARSRDANNAEVKGGSRPRGASAADVAGAEVENEKESPR